MSARVRLGLWLLRPWLKAQYIEQHPVWKDANVTRDFHWGLLMAIDRLRKGKPLATPYASMERAERMHEQRRTVSVSSDQEGR